MCDGCEDKEGLLIPQLPQERIPNATTVAALREAESFSTLPRGLLFWNESRRQDAPENAK